MNRAFRKHLSATVTVSVQKFCTQLAVEPIYEHIIRCVLMEGEVENYTSLAGSQIHVSRDKRVANIYPDRLWASDFPACQA